MKAAPFAASPGPLNGTVPSTSPSLQPRWAGRTGKSDEQWAHQDREKMSHHAVYLWRFPRMGVPKMDYI